MRLVSKFRVFPSVLNFREFFAGVAQMPFGGIVSEPDKKEKEDIDKRVTVLR